MRETNERISLVEHRKASKVILVLSVLVFLFYLSAQVLISDVYQYAFVGAVFEFLSIPMLLLLVVIPILCIVQLIKQKRAARGYVIASFVLIAATILILIQTA